MDWLGGGGHGEHASRTPSTCVQSQTTFKSSKSVFCIAGGFVCSVTFHSFGSYTSVAVKVNSLTNIAMLHLFWGST